MSRRATRLVVVLCLAAVSCGGSAGASDTKRVLRASATHGLPAFQVGASGSTGYALDLQYIPPTELVEAAHIDGRRVTLKRRPDTAYSTAVLAETLHCVGMQSVTRDGELISVLFDTEKDASRFSFRCGFDLGPFELESQDLAAGIITLRARRHRPIDEIQIVQVRPEDEWRKLMARNVDVIPTASGLHRDEFEGVPSISIIDLPNSMVVGLVFDMRSKQLGPAVRRALAGAVDRAAIAHLVCREHGCEPIADPLTLTEQDGTGAAEHVALPPSLSLVLPDVEPFQTVAAHIQYSLARRGVDVSVQTVTPEQLPDSLQRPFQLALVPALSGNRLLEWFRTVDFGHWQSRAFAEALDAGDHARARAILHAQVPGFIVVKSRTFAAVDSHLCGGPPDTGTSWAWLADLRPCEAGDK